MSLKICSCRSTVGHRLNILLFSLGVFLLGHSARAFDAFITMTNGYFYDPATTNAWVPHGIAYQTWNRPLGVWQTFDQIDYDLDEMKKMGANSIRVDFVWQHIEEAGDNQFSWTNYDYLVQAAESRGIRIFALIGYQWPPGWFPGEWYTMHPPDYDSGGIYHSTRWQSDIINYEHPQARAQYKEWFQNVCSHFATNKAIVGWIIGNESGFLGLWSGLLDGYDPWCEQAFRTWCQAKYGTVTNANTYWGTSYSNFSQVSFPEQYRAYGVEGAIWADAVQWREDAIASFTAVGAAAAKAADTNHLISYSTVGMQWGEEDWRYHAEDRGKITLACAASNAPIDFFSVNNYPWSILGHESQNGQWGISFTKKVSGVPVLYSETGFTSSETMWPGMNEQRQGPLIRNAMWESLEAGAIGTHVFAWHDRPYITDREKGFGILYANRGIKPAFWTCRDLFTLMDQTVIDNHLRGSADPTPDIAFLWTAANDSQYNRYECEMQQIAGTLERLGYEPWFMNLEDLAAGAYTNYKVIILPRNMRVDTNVPGTNKGVLEFLRTVVISNGVNVIATGDLPGLQDFNGRPMTNFVDQVRDLFGVDAADIGGHEVPQKQREYVSSYWAPMRVRFTTNALGPLTNGYCYKPRTWKYSDEIKLATGGVLWAEMDSLRNKSFEQGPYSSTNVQSWGAWGTFSNEDSWGWAMSGTNMLHLWGDSGLWQDFPVAPFGRYTVNTYLRSNHDDPLRGGAYAEIAVEWFDKGGTNLGTNVSTKLESMTPGDAWVQYKIDTTAPSNAWTGRRIIRCGSTTNPANLIVNGGLDGSGAAPTGWLSWSDDNFDPDAGTYHTASPAWGFWWDSGIWQDVTNGFMSGDSMRFGGYLLTPSWDRLTNGNVQGIIQLEAYSNGFLQATFSSTPTISTNSPSNTWIYAEGTGAVPAGATLLRVTVRFSGTTGNGRFLADDVFLQDISPGGAVYVDNQQWSPAVVTKDHGVGKAAIFLYGAGDNSPDGNEDGESDVLPWKWRYEVFGAIISNYFGIKPALHLEGTNACYALVDYRTCTNGSILMQLKNYLYDTNFSNGGPTSTFTVVSDLVAGKTIRALSQCRIVETNSDGVFEVSLPPDGQEMLLAYPPSVGTNNALCQIADAPSLVHPLGDQCYAITVKYDTAGKTGLVLKVAFMGNTNQYYQVLSTNCVTGAGENIFWMWIPDPNQSDPAYQSTPQGGDYVFSAWLEDAESNQIAVTLPQQTELEWGIAPTSQVPLNISKGDVTNVPVVWEDLYEQLYWQNTPLTRNEAFPNRVAIYRSTKTEAMYSNQFARINEVCDWLETLGYESGNPTDIAFDNIIVTASAGTNSALASLFSDTMESGTNEWIATGLWHQSTDLSVSPSNSWTYNNSANYVTGARNTGALARAISLSNATSGVSLRFKSWYETEDTGTAWDRKLVQISTNGAIWSTLVQISGTNRQWVSHTIDLGAYAGKMVWIRFYFDTIDGMNNRYRGWFIDDVEVLALQAPKTDLFFDGMESTTNWTAGGLWRQTGSRSNTLVSGTNRWVYNRVANTNYSTGSRTAGALISRWIDLGDRSGATLTFSSWYSTEDIGTAWDRKLVYVTTDGISWTRIYQVSGTAQQWTQPYIDLSAYAGQQIRLKFAFDSIDGMNNNFEGWYIDDVRISVLDGIGTAAFTDRAEEGTNEWSASGLWHMARDLSFSASNSWAYNNGNHYSTGARNSGALISRWIDLADAAGASLSFQSWYETEDAGISWDRKLIFVTTNDTDWVQVAQVSGPNKQWIAQTIDLSLYVGQRIRLKFFFDTVDAMFNYYRGWYLDNIEVKLTGVNYLFADDFSKPATNWTRVAGAGNWEIDDNSLRAWRIGNDDNILCAGDASWTNCTVGANIRYNKQGPYFNDAEIYLRYQDRNNFVKVAIHNFYGAWRLKYTVRVQTNNLYTGWIYEFSRTNQPAENTWYNLKVQAETNTFRVFLNGEHVGSFTDTNFPSGRIAVGTKAVQLGIWDPAKGYYFIDDDEYSYYSPVESETVTLGSPLDLDWGYLVKFFPMLILPGTYVMNDKEASNVVTWLTNGWFSLLATDGGVAMKDETGADDRGRLEPVFGVDAAKDDVVNLSCVQVGTNIHYGTLDYNSEDQVALKGSATAWRTLTQAMNLGTLYGGSTSAPALICNVITQKIASPPKVFCFNYGVDTGGQLTNESRLLSQRAFEWLSGQTYMLTLELKYVLVPGNPNLDVVVFSTNFWTLNGWGTNNLNVEIPMDNVMTGTNLYWVMYTFPWDATNAWRTHKGFFSSGNDGLYTTLGGFGLQLLGITENAYAGRDWDMWVAYNTQGSNLLSHFGIKDKGDLQVEDNFNDGNTTGWTITPNTNVTWSATNGVLRAAATNGGYAWITEDSLAATGQNVTIEFNARWMDDATNSGDGGVLYRGVALGITPRACGWRDAATNLYTNSLPATGIWHHVSVSVRDGVPYPKSDLLIDNKAIFLDEPVEQTNWVSTAVGFLSPYYKGYIEWDNVRIVDEEHSLTTQSVFGVLSPTNANFWPSVPDYDPEKWEYDGTTLGGKYQWYIYFKGEGIHGWQDVNVYFSPRLKVETSNFPVRIKAGTNVLVGVDWEELGTNQPALLLVSLENPLLGTSYATTTNLVTNTTGSAWISVNVPSNAPMRDDYCWVAYLCPTNAAVSNRLIQRIGLDDTYRFASDGSPVEPETIISVIFDGRVFSDQGIPPGYDFGTWQGGASTFNSTNLDLTTPEGSNDFYSWGTEYTGWDVHRLSGGEDMTAYSNGYLKFYLKSSQNNMKIELRGPQPTARSVLVPSTTNTWQEISIPITNFNGVVLSNMYSLFSMTSPGYVGTTNYVDYIRWTKE